MKNVKILYINTFSDDAKIGLIGNDKAKFSKFKSRNRLSNVLIDKIDRLLKENKTNIKDLKAIAVFKGPGSFTGLRIGIATANAFAFSFKIPLIEIGKEGKDLPEIIKDKFVNKRFKKNIIPFYGKPPNITKPKGRI